LQHKRIEGTYEEREAAKERLAAALLPVRLASACLSHAGG
jgi:hypothetical protein